MKRRSLAITPRPKEALEDEDRSLLEGRFPLLEVRSLRVRPGRTWFSGSCRRPVRSTRHRRRAMMMNVRSRARVADAGRDAPARDETGGLCRVADRGGPDDDRSHDDSGARPKTAAKRPAKLGERGLRLQNRGDGQSEKSERNARRETLGAPFPSLVPLRLLFRRPLNHRADPPIDVALRSLLTAVELSSALLARSPSNPSHDRPHCALNRSTPYLNRHGRGAARSPGNKAIGEHADHLSGGIENRPAAIAFSCRVDRQLHDVALGPGHRDAVLRQKFSWKPAPRCLP